MPDSKKEKKSKPLNKNNRGGNKAKRESFCTHEGHALTPLESNFINFYLENGGNGSQAVKEAGYKVKAVAQHAQKLLNKGYISKEINFRMAEITEKKTAKAHEILEYFTDVMRGTIKESDGSDPPIAERTKAAQELAKRIIDIPAKLSEKQGAEYRIILDFGRDSEGEDDEDNT